jgi:hypothetical protein
MDGGSRSSELRGRGDCTESASNLAFGTTMGAPEKDGGGLTGAASSGDVMDDGGNAVALRKNYNCARGTSIYALTVQGWVGDCEEFVQCGVCWLVVVLLWVSEIWTGGRRNPGDVKRTEAVIDHRRPWLLRPPEQRAGTISATI